MSGLPEPPEPAPSHPGALMGSPFTPIADFAFLSDCHTGALLAPDGSVDWLCVPRFDSPSIFGSLLDRGAGSFRLAPFGIHHPTDRSYEPGTNVMVTTWKTPTGWLVVRDALTMGPGDREDVVTPHTRPPADLDAEHVLVRTAECLEGRVAIDLVCEPVFDYGRSAAEWQLVEGDRHAADASGGGQTVRLRSDLALGIEHDRVRARHVLKAGERAFCALSWSDGLAVPRTTSRPRPRSLPPRATGALARPGALPRPSLPRVHPAVGARHQGPHLHAHRGHRRGADDVAARDARRRAQLGLPLHLDPRRDLHAAGACIGSTSTGRPTTSCSSWPTSSPPRTVRLQIMYGIDGERDLTESTLDHLRATTARGRCASATAPTTSGSSTSTARCSTRSTCTRSVAGTCRGGCGRSCSAGRVCDGALAHAGPGHLGGSRGAPALPVLEADVLGRARPRRQAGHDAGESDRAGDLAGTADEVRDDILEHGVSGRGVFRQHYATDALDASTLLAATSASCPPTTSASAPPSSPSPTS